MLSQFKDMPTMGTSTTDSGIVRSLRLAAKRLFREDLDEPTCPRSEKHVHAIRTKGGAKALENAAKEMITPRIAKHSADRDARKKVVMAALHNLGNTCFMNSILQVLYHTPQFCEKIHILGSEVKSTMSALDILQKLNYEGLQPESHLEWVLVSRLDNLLKQMKKIDADVLEGKAVQFAAIRPYDLLDAIEEINSDFQGNQPQDAHELLKCLLMIIDETTNKLNQSRSEIRRSVGDVAPIWTTSPKVKRANTETSERLGLPALFGGGGGGDGGGADAPSWKNFRFEYFDGISRSVDRSELVTSTYLEPERRRGGMRRDGGLGVYGHHVEPSTGTEFPTFSRRKCLKKKLLRADDEISFRFEAPSSLAQPGVSCSEIPAGVHSARVSIPRLDSPRGLQLANISTGYASNMVTELFQGYMLLKTKCLSCGTESTRKEAFQEVSLPFRRRGEAVTSTSNTGDGVGVERDHVSVLELILSILDEVELLDCDNLYLCNNCRHLVKAERRLCYELLPDILTIHLKRFASSLTGNFTKTSDSVDILLELPCLETSCRSKKAPCHRYDLYGIVSHSGKSLLSGHYRAYVRVPSSSSSLTRCSLPVVQLHNIASSVVSYQTSQLLSHNNLHSVAGCSPGEEIIMTPESSDMSTARKASSSGRKSVRKKWGTSFPDAAKESLHTAWYQCNDNVVTALNAQQLLNLLKASGSNTPYILFYHKVTLSKDNVTDCSNRWQSL